MSNKLKKILIPILLLYFFIFSFLEFPVLQSLLLDLTQLIQVKSGDTNSDILTLNINTLTNEFKRPFTFDQLQKIIIDLKKFNPKHIVLMISPKEIINDASEKNKILGLFESNTNLYLFSPYTNGPLGGFKADIAFAQYPRHFAMPLTKDTLFGAKDSKIRRAILSYGADLHLSFLNQLYEMGLTKYSESDFKNYFMLWDTKQFYIKTKKPSAFGYKNLEEVNTADIARYQGKTILIGTFDEFSIHISPSIFDLQQKLSENNFKIYFFPITVSAANMIYAYMSLDYIKKIEINDLLIFALIYILILCSSINNKNKVILSILYIPSIYFLILVLYQLTSLYIDTSKTIASIFWLQYIGMPIYLYFHFKNTEAQKLELANQTRLDAFLTVAEKIAHDIRSPLSSIQLLTSSLESNNPEVKPMINDSIKRINEIAQDILTASKIGVSNTLKTIESVDLLDIAKNIISEKKILNSNITYRVSTNSEVINVLANKIEIQRVISNIIDNSIKALADTPNPQIEIKLFNSNEYYTLEISDNGNGIDTNLLSMLGKFRIDKKDGADKTSHGIGVLHSKRVIESLGGNFEINNNEKESGACVKISLKKFIKS